MEVIERIGRELLWNVGDGGGRRESQEPTKYAPKHGPNLNPRPEAPTRPVITEMRYSNVSADHINFPTSHTNWAPLRP
jgi:hypothetical protein